MKSSWLLVPPEVVTATKWFPEIACGSITNVVVSVVEFTTFNEPMEMPAPLIDSVVAPATKFVPVNVSGIDVPATALAADSDVRVGVVGETGSSVKVWEAEAPMGVVTMTMRGPVGADESIVNGVVTFVVSFTVTSPKVTPVPVTVTKV